MEIMIGTTLSPKLRVVVVPPRPSSWLRRGYRLVIIDENFTAKNTVSDLLEAVGIMLAKGVVMVSGDYPTRVPRAFLT